MKTLLVALWACGLALASSTMAERWLAPKAAASKPAPLANVFEMRKPQPLTVPVIQKGQIQGYVVLRFSYFFDEKAETPIYKDHESLVAEEIFALLYADTTIDFANLRAYDLGKLKSLALGAANARLKAAVVKEIVIHEFNFVTRGEMQ